MPEQSIRFAIRTADGRTSDIWKCWTLVGTGNGDVYLTSRPLGKKTLKLTLHGGEWHIGFDGRKKDELFIPESAPPTKYLGKWLRPNVGAHPIVLAARVLFPWSCPKDTAEDAPGNTVWIPCAKEEQVVEVAVCLLKNPTPPDDWPGKTDMETQMVGRLSLEGGGQVVIVHRTCPIWNHSPSKQGTSSYFREKSKSDLVEANRMIAWGEESDGSITFIESRLVVSDSSVV